MPDGRIHRPHDKFFKDGFSDPATAAALLRHELPPEIAATIDWDRLRLVPGSFLDEKLDHSESDLLFAAPLLPAPGEEADPDAEVCLHLLFEHQSTRDPFMGLRLLRYMVRIWELWLREHGRTKRLPLIIPVVVAQNRTVWRINPQFSALFGPPEAIAPFRQYLPDFAYRLIQVAAIPFDAIRGTPDGIFVLRVLKAERSGELLGPHIWDHQLLRVIKGEIFERFLVYLHARSKIDKRRLRRIIESLPDPAMRRTALTLAEQFRMEGREEGRSQGREEGSLRASQRLVLDALDLRFGPVPAGLREAIESIGNPEKLRSLLRAAIVADSIESFSAAL